MAANVTTLPLLDNLTRSYIKLPELAVSILQLNML